MKSFFKKLSYKHKNNKILYYALNYIRQLFPGILFRRRLHQKLETLKNFDAAYIKKRVNYYNKLTITKELRSGICLADFKLSDKHKVYFFDTYEYTRYFGLRLKVKLLFGDITSIPDEPSLTKSRPADGDHENSVILKLNKVRHFIYVHDRKEFVKKTDNLVWRGVVARPHRARFFEMYFTHPLCNIGQINKGKGHPDWIRERMTIDEQLDYKFILCIEGYDVASNLKWVMSSNSLAVMPKPKFETWFMEGTLIPDHHYVLIKDDYSDLSERLEYYIQNPVKAQEIIQNANRYVMQFKDKKQEDLISLLVLQKYFFKTGQIELKENSLFS